MHYVYILKLSNKNLYTGYTSDLRRIIKEHKRGSVQSTKPWLPVELIHYEAYKQQSDAKQREQFFKKSEGTKY